MMNRHLSKILQFCDASIPEFPNSLIPLSPNPLIFSLPKLYVDYFMYIAAGSPRCQESNTAVLELPPDNKF